MTWLLALVSVYLLSVSALDLETARVDYVTVPRETRLEGVVETVNQATRAHRLATLRYQEGECDLLDVLQLHQRLLDIQQSLYRVELLQLTERVNLHLALGDEFQTR